MLVSEKKSMEIASTEEPMISHTWSEEEEAFLKILTQGLEGVMFHSFERDLFALLKLHGFSKLHEKQVEEEGKNLNLLKDEYIEKYNKIPFIHTERKDYWKEFIAKNKNSFSEHEIIEKVKESLEEYCEWETKALKHLMHWKKHSKDKVKISHMIHDVIEEIEYVEKIDSILEKHGYSHEAICEMSECLHKKYGG